MLKIWNDDKVAKCSCFTSKSGVEEYFLTISSTEQVDFSKALVDVQDKYNDILTAGNLSRDTLVFSRLYLSDIENQKQLLSISRLWEQLSAGCVSVIQQRPIFCGPLSLYSYHIKCNSNETGYVKELISFEPNFWRNGVLLKGNNYSMLWTANFFSQGQFNSEQQTEVVFNELAAVVESKGFTFLNNVIRTWVFVRDVDTLYKGMVRARRDFFSKKGLDGKSRYPASTGIEGKSLSVDSIVHLDSFSIGGLLQEQIVRMEAPDHLSAATLYGVTFDRGARVRFGDRSHIYISGTASIDKNGEVLHAGNVKLQTERTIENVEALLKNQNASIDDVAYFLVYLRDLNDRNAVRNVVEKHFPSNVPCIYAEASVCRPSWLVEIEAIGITEDLTNYPWFL